MKNSMVSEVGEVNRVTIYTLSDDYAGYETSVGPECVRIRGVFKESRQPMEQVLAFSKRLYYRFLEDFSIH